MKNVILKGETIMKNFAKYICLFLAIVGINIAAQAATVNITHTTRVGCTPKAGQQTTITDAQQASNVELLYTIDNGYTGEEPTVSVALEYPATHVSTTLPVYCYRWERQQDNVYRLRLFASAINGSGIGGYKDRDVKISIVCQTGAQKYSLIYDANGGISECSDGEYAAGAITLCSTPPTRDGYSFMGWKASNSSTYAAGAFFTMPAKDETLVAQWSGNATEITLNGNADGVVNGTAHVRMGATTYEDFDRVSKDGATVLGYYTAARGGNKVLTSEGALVRNVAGYTDKSGRWCYSGATLTLHAQYLYDNYQTYCPRVVTFENNGQTTAVMPSSQSGKKGFTVVEPVAKPTVSTGYTFSHWSTTTDGDAYNFATPVTTDFPLYAIWDAEEYTITYTLNYGTNHLSNPTTYTVEDLPITLNDPSRTGYDFQGWFNNKDFSGSAFTSIAVGTTGDLKFWAKWQAHEYTVNYQMNGGTNNSGNITSYPYASSGSFTLLDPISAPTGYHFDKWTKAGGSTKVTTIQYNVAADQTFVANWLPNQYTVTFDKQGGADGSNNVTATYDAAMPAVAMPTKTGYTFGGYYTETNGNGTKYYNADGTSAHVWDIDASPTTLYAKWTANTHTLTWDFADGATTSEESAYTHGTVEYGAFITAPADPTKTGYTFNGWSGYSASMPNADLTITATWTPANYTIICNKNVNGEESTCKDDLEAPYLSSPEVTYICEVPEGFHLASWSISPDIAKTDDVANKKVTINSMPAETVTVTANFLPNLTVTGGDIKVTSANGKTVQSMMTVSATGAFKSGTLAVANVTGTEGGAFAAVITNASSNGTSLDATIAIKYTPVAANVTETATMHAVIEDQDVEFTVTGRSLPEKFVIATKVDGQWYALPNDMNNNYSSSTKAVRLEVNEGTGVATVRNSTTDMFAYQLQAKTPKNVATCVEFSSPIKGGNLLRVDGSGNLGLYAESNWSTSAYRPSLEFNPVSADLVDYTLGNAVTADTYLGLNGENWKVQVAAATVRFFVINEVAPATIRWTNEMTGGDATQFAQNTAENGVVTKPDGTPTSCSDVLYEFVGWSASHTDTYWGVCPTLIQNGDAAIANAEYYAIFKSKRIARWYTKCPNIYTVIYHANTGTGDDIYQESETRTLTTQAASVFTKSGHQIVAWSTVADLSGDDGSATLYKPNTSITVPEAPTTVELYAVWMGDLQLTGTVNLTSYNGVEVFTTANPANQITVSSTDMGIAKKLRFKYFDGGVEKTGTGRVFRVCNTGYSQVDGSLDMTTGAYNQLFNLKYIPNAHNQKDTYTIRVEATNGNGQFVYASADLVVNGRSLPEKFVVAMKNPNDGLWYALKNVLGASAAGATPAPELITVDDNTNPTTATLAPASTFYKGATRQTAGEHRGGLRLQGFNNGNLYLTATKTNNATLYTKNGNDDDQQFYLTSTDLSKYLVTLDPTTGSTRYISMNGGTIGWFTTSAKDVYFLPVAAEMTQAELQVVEWKTDAVVVMYTGAATSATTKVGAGATSEAQTLATAKVDHCVYELTTTDMTSAVGQLLTISFNNGSTKLIKMPWIISGAVTAETGKQGNDVVILKGATFSAATTDYRYPNITVYGGGKLVIGNGTKLAFSNLYLRCGGVVDGNYDYVYPQVVLNGTVNESAEFTHMYIDYLTTKDQYYTFVAPFAISQSAIQYPQDIYGSNVAANNTGSFEFQYYDGAERAAGRSGWAVCNADMLTMAKGYTFLGMPKKINGTRQKFGLHRMTMTIGTSDMHDHEKGNAEIPILGTYISVDPHPSSKDNNAGWNLIGNPYMANLTGLTNESIQVGKLVHTEVDGQWTGGWHWDADGANHQRFLVIPSNDGQSYESVQASSATLPAFKNFFVQIESGTSLFIPIESRDGRSLAPGRRGEAEEKEIEIPLYMEAGEFRDALTYLIKSDYTEAFEFNADMYKMLNNKDTRVNLYGLMNTTEMSFVAVNAETMNASVPVGFSVPAAGEFTIGLSNDQISGVQSVWLTDNEMNITWDLMSGDYEFNVGQKETNNTRFTLRIVMTPQTPTDIGGGGEPDRRDVRKVIFEDKLYIIVDGKVYDATGKTVK